MISIIVETTRLSIFLFPWRYTHVISFGEDAPNLEQNQYKDEDYDNIALTPYVQENNTQGTFVFDHFQGQGKFSFKLSTLPVQ